MCPMSKAHPVPSQLRPQHPALAVHLTSAELGDREGSVALLLPSHKGTGEWGADQNDGVPSPFALTTCIELQPDTISHFQKTKGTVKMAREICSNAYLSATCELRTLWAERHTS